MTNRIGATRGADWAVLKHNLQGYGAGELAGRTEYVQTRRTHARNGVFPFAIDLDLLAIERAVVETNMLRWGMGQR